MTHFNAGTATVLITVCDSEYFHEIILLGLNMNLLLRSETYPRVINDSTFSLSLVSAVRHTCTCVCPNFRLVQERHIFRINAL